MKQEALKLALEFLEDNAHFIEAYEKPEYLLMYEAVIEKCKEALAQPEQEPVGDDWTPCMKLPVVVYVRKQRLGESHVSTREGITPVKPDDLIMRGVSGEEYPIGRAIFEQTYSLNTAPPQRTWIGLAAEDRLTAKYMQDAPDGIDAVIDYIEAKLKQKNGFAEEKNT